MPVTGLLFKFLVLSDIIIVIRYVLVMFVAAVLVSWRRRWARYADVALPSGNWTAKFDVIEARQVLSGRFLR